jgi:hypothetical protein
LGLKDGQREERQRGGRGDLLANDGSGTKEKVVYVIGDDCIYDTDPIEIGQLGFGFTGSLFKDEVWSRAREGRRID